MLKCTLCKSEIVFPLEFLNPPLHRKFFRCLKCDLIFVPEIFHLLPSEEISRYRLHNNTLSNRGYVGMFMEKIAIIHQYCPGVNSVLDYGCGPEPVLAELMKSEGFDCDVYDCYFFPTLPQARYDLVISTEVFEHLRDMQAVFYKILSLLNPGGFLAIATSFHDSVKDLERWWYLSDPTHICFMSNRTFEWIKDEFRFRTIYTNRKNFIILRKGY